MDNLYQAINKRFDSLKNEYMNWRSSHSDLSKYIKPTRGRFDTDPTSHGKLPNYDTIIDGHGAECVAIMATGMMNGLTSPARPWFRLGIQDEELMSFKPVRIWLDDVTQILMNVFERSNVYDTLYSMYEECGLFGTAAYLIQEDPVDYIRTHFYTVGEYFLGCDESGRVNAFGREFYYTVDQMVKKYGIEKCSQSVQNLYKQNKIDEWVKVRQLIEYNDKRIISIYNNKNFEYRSCHWEEGNNEQKFLLESGYTSFPIISPRWEITKTSQVYGYSPAWYQLGNVRMLQTMQEDKLEAVAKVIRPPMITDAKNKLNLFPGGVNYSQANTPNSGARPAYQINPDIAAIDNSITQVKQAMSRGFYNDLFMMFANDNGNQTAFEVAKKYEEKLVMLGSVLNKLEQEGLNPHVERVYEILDSRQLLPPPPQEIQGKLIKIEYVSILAQAQKMVNTSAIERVTAFAGNVGKVKPGALDVIDEDELLLEYAQMLGVPARVLRDKDELQEMRIRRQQEQEKLQMQQDMQNTANIGKTLGDTKVNENTNALGELLGMNEGAA